MKIHILPVSPQFQPPKQEFRCPTHGPDWNVERDFYKWMRDHPELCAGNPEKADFDLFLPFWNLYYINNDWGHKGLDELQAEITRLVNPERPTFTICEYDLPGLQPFLDLRGLTVFTASRRSANPELIDIPLLCSRHETQLLEKRWLACFNGNLSTDGIRIDMAAAFKGKPDVHISGEWIDPARYAETLASSCVALVPRGQGAASFRFYEAMQVGTVPLLLSDIECRPFRKWLDWDSCSLWAKTVEEAVEIVYSTSEWDLLEMGREAKRVYDGHLQYGQWCPYVLWELECLQD